MTTKLPMIVSRAVNVLRTGKPSGQNPTKRRLGNAPYSETYHGCPDHSRSRIAMVNPALADQC
jgi:hypothetical protein